MRVRAQAGDEFGGGDETVDPVLKAWIARGEVAAIEGDALPKAFDQLISKSDEVVIGAGRRRRNGLGMPVRHRRLLYSAHRPSGPRRSRVIFTASREEFFPENFKFGDPGGAPDVQHDVRKGVVSIATLHQHVVVDVG